MQARLICALTIMIIWAGACSRRETAKTLANRLSSADRVIVLNDDGNTLVIRDDLVKKLVQSIATAPKIPGGETLTATPGLTLVFFSSAVHLATVQTAAENFYIDNVFYDDKSGVLRAVGERFWQTRSAPR